MKAKTKILISSFIGLACAAVISVGSTFAWFEFRESEDYLLYLNANNSIVNVSCDLYERNYDNAIESSYASTEPSDFIGDSYNNMGRLRKISGAWLVNTEGANGGIGVGDGFEGGIPAYPAGFATGSVNSGSISVDFNHFFTTALLGSTNSYKDKYFTTGTNLLTTQTVGIAGNNYGALASNNLYDAFALPITMRNAILHDQAYDNDFLHYFYMEFRFYTSSDDSYIRSNFNVQFSQTYVNGLNPNFGSTSDLYGGFLNSMEMHFYYDLNNIYNNETLFYGDPLPTTYGPTDDKNCYISQHANFDSIRYAAGQKQVTNTMDSIYTFNYNDKDGNARTNEIYGVVPKNYKSTDPTTVYDTFGETTTRYHLIAPKAYRLNNETGNGQWTYGKKMDRKPYSAAIGIGLYFNPHVLLEAFNSGEDKYGFFNNDDYGNYDFFNTILRPTFNFNFELVRSHPSDL